MCVKAWGNMGSKVLSSSAKEGLEPKEIGWEWVTVLSEGQGTEYERIWELDGLITWAGVLETTRSGSGTEAMVRMGDGAGTALSWVDTKAWDIVDGGTVVWGLCLSWEDVRTCEGMRFSWEERVVVAFVS